MTRVRADPFVGKALEELFGEPITDEKLDSALGNEKKFDTHLRTTEGLDLYFKAVESAVPYINTGFYTPTDPKEYVLTSDLGAEMFSLMRRPHHGTLLVFSNSLEARNYAQPHANGHMVLDLSKQPPFNADMLPAMYIFDQHEATRAHFALLENPNSSPRHVAYFNQAEHPKLKPFNSQAQEIFFNSKMGRFELYECMQEAHKLVVEHLGNL
ncbi:MAG: hypothetical protein AABX51_09145 [Nanoarchaeota archaeon]